MVKSIPSTELRTNSAELRPSLRKVALSANLSVSRAAQTQPHACGSIVFWVKAWGLGFKVKDSRAAK